MPRSADYLLVLLLAPASCAAPWPRSLNDPDPRSKIPAIKRAVRLQDRSAASQLVADLSSDDPAVRFYAIEGLERLTGETFGYVYFADEADRRAATQQWQQWLRQQERK